MVWLTAPSGGLTVALCTDNLNVVVPASITLEAAVLARDFPIRTSPVAAPETGTIGASVLGDVVSAVLTLEPMGLRSVAPSPNPRA